MNNRQPTLYLTCGVQGSGKTAVARSLETEHAALRLTADEWLHELYPELEGAELDAQRNRVEVLQWQVAVRVLQLGGNVVLDWGLWAREERDTYRAQAQALGARVVLHVLNPPLDELWRRLQERNANLPAGVFAISRDTLERSVAMFQQPTPDELSLFDDAHMAVHD